MKLLVGLGNPGEKYEKTRHNLGFMVVEQLLKNTHSVKTTSWDNNTKLKSDIALFPWKTKHEREEKIVLAKPKTYMNNSGLAVSLIVSFYKIDPENIWVVYDELDLPMGSLKIRFGGAAAGHRGVESIMEYLGTDKFWRFRLGIGLSHQSGIDMVGESRRPVTKQRLGDTSDFVLGKFSGAQWGRAKELIKHGAKALETAIDTDLETAMNRFNSK